MSAGPFSLRRVGLIAQNTLLEAVRQRLVNVLVFLALALVLGARAFRDFNFGAPELKFLADCGFGAMAFFGSALTIATAAQLFFSEIENRTALTLLARPVWRAEFVIGKWLGVATLAALFCAVLTGLLIAVLWTRERELMLEFPESFGGVHAVSYATVATAGLLQALKLAVLAAGTIFVASFAQTQLFTVGAGFFILVICHLQYLAQDAYARSAVPVAKVAGALIGAAFPNFQLFAVADTLVAAEGPTALQVAGIAAYAGGYVVLAGGLAIVAFRHREI
ncbi:MAG: hypothetical protein B9S34_09785 [Opitutia bacterium Tous-C1TDCM]|nr:MAG: hypothetical protein B9S34_09785 [Opitutae bacterium Tous-C1TDCM]